MTEMYQTRAVDPFNVVSITWYYQLLGSKHHSIVLMPDSRMFKSDIKRRKSSQRMDFGDN